MSPAHLGVSGLVFVGAAGTTLEDATMLAPPVDVESSILATGEATVADGGDGIEDVYRFDLDEASIVTIELSTQSEADLDLYVYRYFLVPVAPAKGATKDSNE